MSLGNATNLFVLVSEGTVISTFLIDGLSYSDHLRDKAWVCEEDNPMEEACFSSFRTFWMRVCADTAGRSISATKIPPDSAESD